MTLVATGPVLQPGPSGFGPIRPTGSSGRPRRRRRAGALRLISPVAVLIAWWAGSATGLISPAKLPSPQLVARAAGHLWVTGQLLPNLWASTDRVLFGLGLGISIGSVLGVIAGLAKLGDAIVDPLMQALRTLPVLALVPLFIVWFGIGQTSKVYMIAFATAFPIYINLYAGIRGIDPKLLEAAKTLRLTRRETLRHVVAPGATASFLVGLRFATATAWLVLIVVEQINASSGIGYLIVNAESYLEVNIIMVGIVIYAVLGLTSDAIVRFLERRMLAWR